MDTIFALATAPGKSGVAVIRISGNAAKNALAAFGVNEIPVPRIATLATLKQDNEAIEKALLLYFPAPHSFTGEDVVEIHCHGSRAVIKKLIGLLAALPGLRMAEPGEFARRAFLNGKMDLTAAEGLADLIDAETEAQRKQAMRSMDGDAARFYEELRESILHTLAFLEAYIDFPDEDIPEEVLGEIDAEIQSAIQTATSQLSGSEASERIREGICIAILGAPNAGKSSLMNLLARRDVAIVSGIAGTTRDVIEVHLDIKGYPVVLADTAGIRENTDSIEQEGIRRSLERAKTADIKLLVLDATSPLSQDIASIASGNTIIILNKSDLAPQNNVMPVYGVMPILFSVKERSGVDELLQAIEHRILATVPQEESFVTHSRHRAHLTAALTHLTRYEGLRAQGLELRCEELRRAATEVGRITGKITSDEVLGHIFSSFCIGK